MIEALLVGVAIKGDNNKSKGLVRWAIQQFASRKHLVFKLFHVQERITSLPTPHGISIPISSVPEEVEAVYKSDLNRKTREMLNPYVDMFARKEVRSEIVVIESDDTVDAISRAVEEHGINELIVGASSYSIFSCLCLCRRRKRSNLSSKILDCSPRFCTVHIISRGRLLSVRPSDKEQEAAVSDSRSEEERVSADCQTGSASEPPSLLIQRLQALSNVNQTLGNHGRALSLDEDDESKKKHCPKGFNCTSSSGQGYTTSDVSSRSRLQMETRTSFSGQGSSSSGYTDSSSFVRQMQDLDRDSPAKEKEKQEEARKMPEFDPQYMIFEWEEIVEATSSFSDDLNVGMGAYGNVYKCCLHHTDVAVKVLHPDKTGLIKQFQQELEILSKIRHPHLLLLLGACPERGCLIYEFMHNGSLEELLFLGHGGSNRQTLPPLPWFDRFRIASEIASALYFLHSTRPKPIVHRDLKPANILLDRNFVSKIGDVGLSKMLNVDPYHGSTLFNQTGPVGTFFYIDPEYQRTGLVSTESDVYAFGIILLQLVTAKPAMALAHAVEKAMREGKFAEMVDATAGDWPEEDMTEIVKLGLRCTELRRRDRPNLGQEIIPALERLKNVACMARNVVAPKTLIDPPSHFLCPLRKDIMEDPCVAADGYTYDRRGIEEWLQGNDKSPMTDLPFPDKTLLPSHSLLSAIKEWRSTVH
ncbi:PREDICTED: U-box domain-containing protein 51-like isoform X2 [Tarenaya hassleriana]|uniref:U-box domain-containing protein 51-like isoform X2 n=1 Tax=Tarenaya hassleriana TaxID=28532 RepID=UPI00053CA198|nr:PREDICTED: U-box domain-containing protein 51-like isoform X2 [Tarenaya hassleriana]